MPEFETTDKADQETDEFIKAPPSWLIRNGTILMIVTFAVLIAGAYFMPYPDTVEGKGVIRAYQSSVIIYAPGKGRLFFINVKDRMKVNQHEVIAITTNDPSNKAMLNIHKLINSIDTSKNIKGLLSDDEFCKALRVVETEKRCREFVENIKKIKGQLSKHFIAQSESSVRKAIFSSTGDIRKVVDDWKNKNTLMSPVDGYIYYLRPNKLKDNMEKGEALFSMTTDAYSYSIQVEISPSNSTYIKKGQQCFIKIEEYPYQRYGLLIGTVSKINNSHSDSTYTVSLSSDKNLLTTKMVRIPDKAKYFINASIVIRNRSLLNRLIPRQND
jgi:hypothetical protein